MLKYLVFFIVTTFLISACSSSSSHLLVGQTRTAISADEVQIYTTEPPHYQEIAIVNATSKGSFSFSDQARMNAALQGIKEEAAKLGANGVILTSVKNQQVLSDDGGSNSRKAIDAIAIHVPG